MDRIETRIIELVDERGEGKTICPSEVARSLDVSMDDVRSAAADLASAGEIVVTQKGVVVDVASARGPIRLGRPI